MLAAKPPSEKKPSHAARHRDSRLHEARSGDPSAQSFTESIGESHLTSGLFDRIRRAARVDANVLITGESGTGKDVVARTLHRLGARATSPFVAVNCTAIPQELLESELFGHVHGAFPDRAAARQGLFELANGGTLFFDEVGDLGIDLQAKLLRVFRDREVRPVGSSQSTRVNVRIVCATNRNLEVETEVGRFLEDLYYRINVIPLHIDPLRQRPEDVPALVDAFTRKYAGRDRRFTRAAIRQLQTRVWRGNARELENVVERTLILCDANPIDAQHLPPEEEIGYTAAHEALLRGLSEAARTPHKLAEITDLYILEMLKLTSGRKGDAARRLGIDRKTLYRRGASLDFPPKR